MDPIRTPRRNPAEREDHFARYVLAAVSFVALIAFGAQYYLEYRASEQTAAARAPTAQVPPVPRVIYRCVGADGSSHDQPTPCVFEQAPPAPAPAARPNPNQSLLDQADARYARERQSAARARQQFDQAVTAVPDARYRGYSCADLCSELGRLRTRMRSAYSVQQSEDFHQRQNRIFQQMQAHDCRACP